jgi:hypothetical protein
MQVEKVIEEQKGDSLRDIRSSSSEIRQALKQSNKTFAQLIQQAASKPRSSAEAETHWRQELREIRERMWK